MFLGKRSDCVRLDQFGSSVADPLVAVLCLYVRIPDYEPYHRALYLRERTVREFINCTAGKYDLNADERGRIKRVAIRTPIGIVPVDDDDIDALRNETEMYLKCVPIQGEVDNWQLEIS